MKPLLWRLEGNIPYKCYPLFDSEKRKVELYKYTIGVHLPCSRKNHFNCDVDPKKDELIFEIESLPEKFSKYDVLTATQAMAPLINQKVIDILRRICPDDFQVFPVVIRNENDKMKAFENEDYYLLNITKEEDLIDWGKSKLEMMESGNVFDIDHLVLKENMRSGICRLKRSRVDILVSEDLAKVFKKEKVKGVKFREAHEYA